MITLREIKESVLQLLFPHVCAGCGNDILSTDSSLCLRCISSMPETNFEKFPNNPVEKTFWGRLPLASATAQFYFTKESLMQHLMHQFKYKGNTDLGFQAGILMGNQLKESGRFNSIDALVPLPLFASKEKRRGYNQATILCQGMAEKLKLPILTSAISRTQHTDTQTKKGRIDRWKNMDGKFILTDTKAISNKHILLVDDVVTTGATLEACGQELLQAPGTTLSIATLCYASR
jgi:ComF family protein